MTESRTPAQAGAVRPGHEHDACGVGFVVNIKGTALARHHPAGAQVLQNLTHRGACGCDPETGDGAGMLIQIPHAFLREGGAELEIALPEPGAYGVGMVFLPSDVAGAALLRAAVREDRREEGQRLLGWRDVPVIRPMRASWPGWRSRHPADLHRRGRRAR